MDNSILDLLRREVMVVGLRGKEDELRLEEQATDLRERVALFRQEVVAQRRDRADTVRLIGAKAEKELRELEGALAEQGARRVHGQRSLAALLAQTELEMRGYF